MLSLCTDITIGYIWLLQCRRHDSSQSLNPVHLTIESLSRSSRCFIQ